MAQEIKDPLDREVFDFISRAQSAAIRIMNWRMTGALCMVNPGPSHDELTLLNAKMRTDGHSYTRPERNVVTSVFAQYRGVAEAKLPCPIERLVFEEDKTKAVAAE